MPYTAAGERVEARDVLDPEELADYTRRRTRDAHYRLAQYARTGVLPRAINERTEDAVMDEYERHVWGGGRDG